MMKTFCAAGVLGLMVCLALTGCKSDGGEAGLSLKDSTVEVQPCATCESGEACAVCAAKNGEVMEPASSEKAVCEVCERGDFCPSCTAKKSVVKPIEAVHGKAAYDAMGAAGQVVKATFDVDFGGGDLMAGTMWFDTQVGKVRMELDDGTVVVFDGETCWVSEGAPEIGNGYRFHVLTWPYFLAAPFKLSDPGVSHEWLADAPLTPSRTSVASKMTFDAGVGDAPDDWYVVFPNPQHETLAALAYIVTFNKSAEEAENQPSIVFYTAGERVDGVLFATRLFFHYWDLESGVNVKTKGEMAVSELAFVEPPVGAFEKFEGAVVAGMPGGM